MRELIFRDWGGEDMIIFDLNTLNVDASKWFAEALERPQPFMQFTGLHDKNGVRIFEGDILKSRHYVDFKGVQNFLHHTVKWSHKFTGFIIENITDSGTSIQLWSVKNVEFEIIGNIHQNQELLK